MTPMKPNQTTRDVYKHNLSKMSLRELEKEEIILFSMNQSLIKEDKFSFNKEIIEKLELVEQEYDKRSAAIRN